jgi:hypothetical protein
MNYALGPAPLERRAPRKSLDCFAVGAGVSPGAHVADVTTASPHDAVNSADPAALQVLVEESSRLSESAVVNRARPFVDA